MNEPQTIWYVVADLNEPIAEPFVVIRVDTKVKMGSGVEGTIESLHWHRAEAESICHRLNGNPLI